MSTLKNSPVFLCFSVKGFIHSFIQENNQFPVQKLHLTKPDTSLISTDYFSNGETQKGIEICQHKKYTCEKTAAHLSMKHPHLVLLLKK